MSYTVINDWYFLEDADLNQALSTIRQYMAYLRDNEPELEQSLWLYSDEEPLRYFHVASYSSKKALDRQIQSVGTSSFIAKISSMIDPESVKRPAGPVVANFGSGPGEI